MALRVTTVPKVIVPADFGIEHLGSPSHSNLTFNLSSDGKILANSIIISLNSPVIDDLTTNLLQTSIDVDDFERDAVQCFVEGCYTGQMKKLTKINFRGVNKMAHVFKVVWMEKRCEEFFESLTNTVHQQEFQYNELLFLFEEAFYVQTTLKCLKMVDKVAAKFDSIPGCKRFFIERFMETDSLNEKQLDVMIKMVGKDTQILVNCIISLVTVDTDALSSNCRYLLHRLNLGPCFRRYPDLQKILFESLSSIKNPTPEDYRLVLSLFKASNKNKFASIPNLFHPIASITQFGSFDELFQFLRTSTDVTSLYMLIEGIFCWLFDRKDNTLHVPENIVPRILEVKQSRGWDTISNIYVENLPRDDRVIPFLRNIRPTSANLVSEDHVFLACTLEYEWETFLLKENDIEFQFDENTAFAKSCSMEGNCGLIVHLTPGSDEDSSLFNIQLLADPAEYPSHIHFHEDLISSKDLHFTLQCYRTCYDRWRYFPISWSGKPECNNDKNIWRWGANCFADKSEKLLGFSSGIKRHWLLRRNVKIKPEIFVKLKTP